MTATSDRTKVRIHFAGLCMFLCKRDYPRGEEHVTVLLLDPAKTQTGLCHHAPVMTGPQNDIAFAPGLDGHTTLYTHWGPTLSTSDPYRRDYENQSTDPGRKFGFILSLVGKRVRFVSPMHNTEWEVENWRHLLSLNKITGQRKISPEINPHQGLPAPIVSSIIHLPPGVLRVQLSTETGWRIGRMDEGGMDEGDTQDPINQFGNEIVYEFEVSSDWTHARMEISGIGTPGRHLVDIGDNDDEPLPSLVELGISNLCSYHGQQAFEINRFDPDIAAYYEITSQKVPYSQRNVLWNDNAQPGISACPPGTGNA